MVSAPKEIFSATFYETLDLDLSVSWPMMT